MSGPKVDAATIRAQEMAKLAAARDGRKKVSDRIQGLIKEVENCLGNDLELMMQDENLRGNCKEISSRQSECLKGLNHLLRVVKAGNEMLNVDGMMNRAEQLVKEFKDSIQGELLTVGQLAKTSESYQQLLAYRQKVEQTKKKNIVRLMSAEINEEETISSNELDELFETLETELSDFMKSTQMSTKHKNSILLFNQDLKELKESEFPLDRKEKKLKRLFEEYQKVASLIKTDSAEMQYIYQEYIKECFDLSIPIKGFEEFGSKKELEQEIQVTKKIAETQLSKEYIKRQIDEVMTKHGYNVVKSDLLQDASESGQVLYGVDKDTAIDVFVSNENQVTMRVVGIGFDSDISAAEDEQLLQQQCAFCSLHPKITAELAMRGVVLETKKHMPPDKKFNKKIKTKSKNEFHGTSRLKKELKRSELKTMHKE